MSEAAWMPDPSGAHELRWWDGAAWTDHVADQGVTAVDPMPSPSMAPPPAPAPAAVGAVPSADAAAPAKGSWKDKLKAAAEQGKQLANQAKTTIGEQQAKKAEQWRSDPSTLWFGESQSAANKVTGMSKASYRITKDRVWIDSGMFGVSSQSVPLWSVKDLDVRQNLLQRGKDIGDVVLLLDDATYGVAEMNTFNLSGMHEPGHSATGEVVLDNIEGPFQVRELLLPLISEARHKKVMERQSQYVHVNPVMGAAMGVAGAAPVAAAPVAAPAGPPVDLADQLRKLAELRDQGILTEEEFAAQKAKLLG